MAGRGHASSRSSARHAQRWAMEPATAADAGQQLFRIAANHLEAAAEDLEIVDRQVRVRGVPDRGVPIAKLAQLSMEFGAKYEPVFGRGSVATVVRSPAFAVHLADVEV